MPPSGHVAGIWGRNDDTRGVHKAPANEVVRGAIDIEINITRNEHDLLNPEGINVHPRLPGPGYPRLGCSYALLRPGLALSERPPALQLPGGVDPRRAPTGWSSSPTTQALWAKIRRTIAAFLVMQWRAGALFGATPDEAFYVKCDGETNPSEGIDAGQVVCEIGVAPVKPAEFVIFRLAQFSGGTSLVSRYQPTPTRTPRKVEIHATSQRATAQSATRSVWSSTASPSRHHRGHRSEDGAGCRRVQGEHPGRQVSDPAAARAARRPQTSR